MLDFLYPYLTFDSMIHLRFQCMLDSRNNYFILCSAVSSFRLHGRAQPSLRIVTQVGILGLRVPAPCGV